MPFKYNNSALLLCAAKYLPRPLSVKCIRCANQLKKVVEGSVEHTNFLTELKQYEAWNEWTQVADTYLLLQDKENSPRNFFMYWRDNLSKQLAHNLQYNAIAEAIKKKKNSNEYSNIDLHALLDSFINNPRHHPHTPQAGNDGIAAVYAAAGQDEVALEEEEDDDNGSNNINNDDNNNEGRILELEGQVLKLQGTIASLEQELATAMAGTNAHVATAAVAASQEAQQPFDKSATDLEDESGGGLSEALLTAKMENLGLDQQSALYDPPEPVASPSPSSTDADSNSEDDDVGILYHHF